MVNKVDKELKTAIKGLKYYWFGTDWEDMDKKKFKALVKLVNTDLAGSLEVKIDKAFSYQEDRIRKFMRKLDAVYDSVMFFYMIKKNFGTNNEEIDKTIVPEV